MTNLMRKYGRKRMELISQKMRKLAPELDPLRIGTGWKKKIWIKYRLWWRAPTETVIREADT